MILFKSKNQKSKEEKLVDFVKQRHKIPPENRIATKEEYDEYLKKHDPRIFTSKDGAGEHLDDFV